MSGRSINNKNDQGQFKGGSVSAEKAKDKALAKEKQEQKEAHLAFYGAGYSGEDDLKGIGSSHQAHAERKDYVGHDEFDLSFPSKDDGSFHL